MFFNSDTEGRLNFDLVSQSYDLARPGYPNEMFNDIIQYSKISPNNQLLEIGSGSGQATKYFVKSNYAIDVIEPSKNLMAILKQKFKEQNNIHFIEDFFETSNLKTARYDLVFSGNAFHWIDKEVGLKKLNNILKTDGTFSASWNLPKLTDDLVNDIETLSKNYLDDYIVSRWSQDADDLFKQGYIDFKNNYTFKDCSLNKYDRVISYSADLFIPFLKSYSNFAALAEKPKRDLFRKVNKLIQNNY